MSAVIISITAPRTPSSNGTDVIISTYMKITPRRCSIQAFPTWTPPPVPSFHRHSTPATPRASLMPDGPCPSHAFLCHSQSLFLLLVGPTFSPWAEHRPQPSAKPSPCPHRRSCLPGVLPEPGHPTRQLHLQYIKILK